jgi:Fe-S cluster assembly ATP-binding protein
MNLPLLAIENVSASTEESPILRGVNLNIRPGEIHAIMGPNGAGKSTLAKVLTGHPSYEMTSGAIYLEGEEISEMEPEERAHKGLFMGFQYPVEVPGVSNVRFLHMCYNAKQKAHGKEEISEEAFRVLLREKMDLIGVPKEFIDRNLNEGFSGGEKKRNEILQMAVLEPKISILDETDSGLDIDAMRIVAEGVRKLMNGNMGLLLITHYQRLLEYIRPDFVHVMVEGKIVRSGGADLALLLESEGYQSFGKKAG